MLDDLDEDERGLGLEGPTRSGWLRSGRPAEAAAVTKAAAAGDSDGEVPAGDAQAGATSMLPMQRTRPQRLGVRGRLSYELGAGELEDYQLPADQAKYWPTRAFGRPTRPGMGRTRSGAAQPLHSQRRPRVPGPLQSMKLGTVDRPRRVRRWLLAPGW